MIELLADQAALDRIGAADISALTEAATEATFYADGLTAEQVAANRRIVAISAETCLAAAASPDQRFVAAVSRGDLRRLRRRHGPCRPTTSSSTG